MKYRIVIKDTAMDLALAVQKAIEDGWEPQGGVGIDGSSRYNTYYYQAMVKRNAPKESPATHG